MLLKHVRTGRDSGWEADVMANEANRTPRIEKLTSSIREMASRVNAEFVPDNRKSQIYGVASDQNLQMMASEGPTQQKG